MSWQKRIRKVLEPYGISHAQFVILAILLWFEEHQYDATQALLVSWSQLDKMTVSKSLKKLHTLGFVSRSEHLQDTRAKRAILTDKGRELARQLVPIVEKADAEFFGIVSEKQQNALVEILGKLSGGTYE